jgi:hypothetical protein
MKIALEEIAYPDRSRDYEWFDAALAASRLGKHTSADERQGK